MEIDKKIIKKLIEVLEDLKKSLNGNEIINNEEPIEENLHQELRKIMCDGDVNPDDLPALS